MLGTRDLRLSGTELLMWGKRSRRADLEATSTALFSSDLDSDPGPRSHLLHVQKGESGIKCLHTTPWRRSLSRA